MKKFLLGIAAVGMICIFSATAAFAGYFEPGPTWYPWMGTAWDPGADTARDNYDDSTPPEATFPDPGGATWSIIEGSSFVGMTGIADVDGVPYEIWAINEALNCWADVSDFTNLGLTDGSSAASGDPNSAGGNAGDIRIGTDPIAGSNVLAYAYNPNTEANYSPLTGGSMGGDITYGEERFTSIPQNNRDWVADPSDTIGPGSYGTYDFFTDALHEIGHALGLDHPYADDVSRPAYYTSYPALMEMYNRRGEAMNALSTVDIYLIQTLYGEGGFTFWESLADNYLYMGPSEDPGMIYATGYTGTIYGDGEAPVPEPATILLLGSGLLGLFGIGRKKFKRS